jgi:hypothetical protein
MSGDGTPTMDIVDPATAPDEPKRSARGPGHSRHTVSANKREAATRCCVTTPDVSGPAPTFWGSRRTARRHGSWSTGRSCRCARSRSRQTNETRRGGADPRRQGSATQGTQTAAGADHCGRPVPVGARVCCSSSPTRGYPSGSSRRARNGWPRQRSGSGRPYSTGVDRLRGPGPGPARRLRRREGRLPRALDRKEHKNSAHRIDRAAASAAASTVQPGPQLFVFDEADT